MKQFALSLVLPLLLAAPVVHGATVLGGILSPAPGANLYVSDRAAGNIYVFTPAGVQSTFATGLDEPEGLAFDAAGSLYVSNTGGTIFEFTPGGVQSTFVSSGLTTAIGLAFDSAGNLYVGDNNANKIYEYTPPSTAQSTFASAANGPEGLAFNTAGDLFVAYITTADIKEFTPSAGESEFFMNLSGPKGLAFDAAGNLYEADSTSGNVFEFTPAGVKSTFASGLSTPVWLAFAPAPNDDFQIRYFSNVNSLGGSLINLSNTGAIDPATAPGTICANIYVFDPNEEELECCTCQITPNALQSISVTTLLSQNLTPEHPDSTVVKLLATGLTGGTCNATTAGSAANPLVPGLRAWAATLHQTGATPNITYGTETEFSFAGSTLSQGELNRLTNTCGFIIANGSGNGICKGCNTAGGL